MRGLYSHHFLNIPGAPWNFRVMKVVSNVAKNTPLRFDSIVCHPCPDDGPLGDADRRA